MKMIDGVVSIVKTDELNVDIEHKELVMCKNCKWLDTHDHRCKAWNHGISEEDWCSQGERKEDVIK